MFEILIVSAIIATSGGVYFFAVAQGLRERLSDSLSYNAELRTELREWQNKALLKHGNSILGAENKTPKQPSNEDIKPTIPTRAELERRVKRETTTSIHANSIAPAKREVIIEQAREIIDLSK